MIDVKNLTCAYGEKTVLTGLDVHVGRGDMVGILGPNGSGKTTLLRAIAGTLTPVSGRVRINGHDLAAMRPKTRARLMACIPQRLEAVFDMPVRSLVRMGRYPYASFLRGYTDRDEEAVTWAMETTSILHLGHRYANELSGGEWQRVLIARALAQKTPLLLLDEAASGLDVGAQAAIYELLTAHNRKGMTIVSVIHNLNLAALYCNRLMFLTNGSLVLDGPVEDVFTQDHLSRIYDVPLSVVPHPVTGAPQCFLVPGASSADDESGRGRVHNR